MKFWKEITIRNAKQSKNRLENAKREIACMMTEDKTVNVERLQELTRIICDQQIACRIYEEQLEIINRKASKITHSCLDNIPYNGI